MTQAVDWADTIEHALGLRLPGDWFERMERFRALLCEANGRHNLTRLTGTEAFYIKHVLDSLLVVKVLPELSSVPLRVADVGCGGGFPGLPLLMTFPQLRVAEIDSSAKKVNCVSEFARALSIDGCSTIVGRARELARQAAHRESFDVVLTRAVGETHKLVKECRGLLRSGGCWIAYKTPSQLEEERPFVEREASKAGCCAEASDAFDLPSGAGRRQFWILRVPGDPLTGS